MQSTRFCFKVTCCHISVCNSWWHCLGTVKAKVAVVGQVWRDIKDFYFFLFFLYLKLLCCITEKKVCHLTLETGFSRKFFFFTCFTGSIKILLLWRSRQWHCWSYPLWSFVMSCFLENQTNLNIRICQVKVTGSVRKNLSFLSVSSKVKHVDWRWT